MRPVGISTYNRPRGTAGWAGGILLIVAWLMIAPAVAGEWPGSGELRLDVRPQGVPPDDALGAQPRLRLLFTLSGGTFDTPGGGGDIVHLETGQRLADLASAEQGARQPDQYYFTLDDWNGQSPRYTFAYTDARGRVTQALSFATAVVPTGAAAAWNPCGALCESMGCAPPYGACRCEFGIDYCIRCDCMPLPPSGRIVGQVARAVFGTPIVGAQVEALRSGSVVRSAVTDDTGYYAINRIDTGEYEVRASAAGFITQTAYGVQVAADTDTVVNFALPGEPITSLCGRVAAGDAPATGVAVQLRREGVPTAVTTTDSSGNFCFTGLPPGAYEVSYPLRIAG